MRQFVFGYGSLINDVSRARTARDGNSVAGVVRLNSEFERAWCFRAGSGFTALGLRRACPESSSSIRSVGVNGVVFEVRGDAEMAEFDLREEGYRRVQLLRSQVEILRGPGYPANQAAALEAALADQEHVQLWAYVVLEEQEADEQHPVLMTYVDVCVEGCLARGKEMAQEFIEVSPVRFS